MLCNHLCMIPFVLSHTCTSLQHSSIRLRMNEPSALYTPRSPPIHYNASLPAIHGHPLSIQFPCAMCNCCDALDWMIVCVLLRNVEYMMACQRGSKVSWIPVVVENHRTPVTENIKEKSQLDWQKLRCFIYHSSEKHLNFWLRHGSFFFEHNSPNTHQIQFYYTNCFYRHLRS